MNPTNPPATSPDAKQAEDTPLTDAAALWPASNDSPDQMTPTGGYVAVSDCREIERAMIKQQRETAYRKEQLRLANIDTAQCEDALNRLKSEHAALVRANGEALAREAVLREALERLMKAEDASCDEFTAKEIDEIEAAMEQARAALAHVAKEGNP